MSKTETNGLIPELEHKRHAAAIMFVRHCSPVKMICERLKISTATFTQWSKTGYWPELRPGSRLKANPSIRKAQVLYVKNGLSLSAISQQLHVSMPTLKKWKDGEAWDELRQDFELQNLYKAANLYIEKGMNGSEIAMQLGISETTINLWAYLYGWDAARLISKAENVTADIVAAFCLYFKNSFPEDATKIEVVENHYINSIKPKI
jgi:uncharacterized protein YjcR